MEKTNLPKKVQAVIKSAPTKFYVNQEKDTIVCVIESEGRWVQSLGFYIQPIRAVGKAKRNPEDVWNEELGRKYAHLRAKKMFDKKLGRQIQAEVKSAKAHAQSLDDIVEVLALRVMNTMVELSTLNNVE